ncbi:hypothetical protein GDO86_013644 [Hymenochirus boettgeri]|uniref:Small ribosomal subunit protein uS15m n=1 Tax=Hymenochirus boettgeri TaxID=247094 RepID=A0A8T2IS65_9PIPI|nr:hypothetical protein GDO86_013644 [Hymenochirus boettgeri]
MIRVLRVWGRGFRVNTVPLCTGKRPAVERRPQELRTTYCHAVRSYAQIRRREELPSQLDDLPSTMLKKEYTGVQIAGAVNDVVKRLLSLEMASQAEKHKIKTQQLVDKVRSDPQDTSSVEVKIAVLTAKIRSYQEHIQKHPKDKANKRKMLMTIDKRKKLLKLLRRTRYDTFEHVCSQLDIVYTFPPEYYRPVTRRWLAKKALCIKVFQEAKKLRAAGLLRKKRPVKSGSKPEVNQAPGTPV